MDLERELRAMPVDWPPTPHVQLDLERSSRRRRWPLIVALAAVALAAALAVPQSRGAIFRFFGIGADRLQFVATLPPAAERPIDAGLGAPVTPAAARATVPGLLLLQLDPPPALRRSGEVVSLVFRSDGKTVLLSEVSADTVFLKKLAGGFTNAAYVHVRNDAPGLWLSGKPHIFFFPREPARLAGNTLVWAQNGTTYRLEGPGLTQRAALDLAASLRDTP
jgi:hypothetical protein